MLTNNNVFFFLLLLLHLCYTVKTNCYTIDMIFYRIYFFLFVYTIGIDMDFIEDKRRDINVLTMS